MRNQRTVSQYSTIKHHNHPHCPMDPTCRTCCPCVEQYQNQNKVLKDKCGKIGKEKDDLEKTILKLTKIIAEFQKRKEEFDKIDLFKIKVREAIKKQMEDEKKAQDFILMQKIENSKKEKKQFQQKIAQFQQQSSLAQTQICKLQDQLHQANQKSASLQQSLKKAQSLAQQQIAKYQDLKQKQQNLQKILQQKSSTIGRMQSALSQSQKHFMSEKIKARNNEFQAIRHQQQVKMKLFEINSLQKTAEEKNNSINNLAAQKDKLGKLVAELDSTVHSYSNLSNHLRERIIISQDYALQKQIQCKQLQMQFYDSIYSRYPPCV